MTKDELLDWVEKLELQTLTDELKTEIYNNILEMEEPS